MPSGKIHSFTTVLLAGTAAAIGYKAGYPPAQIAPLVGGVGLGLLLTPDLDVDRGCVSNKHARQIFGRLFGLVWENLWKPYALIIPHRSPLSHTPVLGTALRLGYLALVAWLVCQLLDLAGLVQAPPYQPWMGVVFAGLCLSDGLHVLLDLLL